MTKIIPAVLPYDAADLQSKVASLPADVHFLHLDVLEQDIWTPIRKEFEAHLMVADPGAIADRWAERGAKRIIVHSLSDEILKHRDRIEIGLAVELHVPLEEVYPQIEKVHFIQLMAIAEIGEQGHPFEEKVFDRIKEVKGKFPHAIVTVDGGVNTSNMNALFEAGADRLIVGKAFQEVWSSQTKEK